MQSLQKIISNLASSPQILKELMSEIPRVDQYDQSQYNWSIAEHCNHICRSDSLVYHGRIQQMIQQPELAIAPADGETFGEGFYQSLEVKQELEDFQEARQSTIEMLQGLSESQFKQSIQHPEYQKYSLELALRHLMLHDYTHMYRIEHQWLSR